MKITTLIENTAPERFISEWGLSLYIEFNGKSYLLDTGASGKFIKNAKTLGISIEDVDRAVLSHAHFDHAYGMNDFFKANSAAPFYLRAGSGENCYSKHSFFKKYIGLKKGTLRKWHNRILFADGNYQIDENVYLIPHSLKEVIDAGAKSNMFVKENGKMVPERFDHEQSLVFDTDQGLVIFNSCSHGGADNIIREVVNVFPGKKLYAYIGGFHTFSKSRDYMNQFADRLIATGISVIYTGHCTGMKNYRILEEKISGKVHYLATGTVLSL